MEDEGNPDHHAVYAVQEEEESHFILGSGMFLELGGQE